MPGVDCCFLQDAVDEEAEAQGVTSLKQLTGSSKKACLFDILYMYIMYICNFFILLDFY